MFTNIFQQIGRPALAIMAVSLASATMNAQTVRVSTDKTDLVMKVSPKGRLYQVYLGDKLNNAADYDRIAWNTYAASDGAVSTRGHEVCAASGNEDYFEPAVAITHADGNMTTYLRYKGVETKAVDGGTETIITLQDDKYPDTVKLHYVAYNKENVIKAWSEISHNEKSPVTLWRYSSTMLYFNAPKYYLTSYHSDWAKEGQPETVQLTAGKKIIDTKLGTRAAMHTEPFFELGLNEPAKENEGNVVLGTIGWTGNFRFTFEVDNVGGLRVIPAINPYASDYKLRAGETFTTPEFIFTTSSTGTSQASRNLHDWARRYQVNMGMGDRMTLLNNWENTGFDFNQKSLAELMKDAKDLGVDMFLLDDGWFANKYPRNNDKAGLGDWQVNVAKLPEGIDFIASHAHEKGLKFGIWIEPEMVNPKSELYEKHPDWIVKDNVHAATAIRNQYLLDMTNPKVQDFVYGVFDDVMKLSDKIDYIKWDANRHVENVGSSWLPSDEQTMFWVRYAQGLYNVMERVRAKYPDVMIQACASGGGRVEYGELKYFDEFWTSDDTEALTRTGIQYGTSLFYPANQMGSHVSAVPNHQTGNITPIKFRFDIACAGRLGMELQPKSMTDSEKEFARRAIASYKEYRDIIMTGDLYRIGSPYDKSGTYGVLYVTPDKKRAVFLAYCISYDTRNSAPQFRLDGLAADKNYRIAEVNVDKSSSWFSGKVLSGSMLMNKGVNPPLKKVYDSAVFVLESEE